MTDIVHFRFKRDPQLSLQKDKDGKDYWQLSYTADIGGEEHHFELRVKVAWDGEGWYKYKFFACDYALHDPKEMITREDLEESIQNMRDNLGDEIADTVIEETVEKFQVIRGIEITIRDALIRRWLAMCELVKPHVTL